ncbi:MAG: MarR family winged helix-turn-helix transcriptional regulator [Bacillota bacterium]
MDKLLREDVTDLLVIFTSLPATILKGFTAKTEQKLNLTQKKTLLFIYQHEGFPMKYYSKLANLESGSFTYAANELEKKGLIRRLVSDDDHRKTGLALTEKGRETAVSMYEQLHTHVFDRLSVLTQDEMRKFFRALRILNETQEKIAAGMNAKG